MFIRKRYRENPIIHFKFLHSTQTFSQRCELLRRRYGFRCFFSVVVKDTQHKERRKRNEMGLFSYAYCTVSNYGYKFFRRKIMRRSDMLFDLFAVVRSFPSALFVIACNMKIDADCFPCQLIENDVMTSNKHENID